MSRFAARSGLLIGFAGTQRNRNQHGVKVVWSWRVIWPIVSAMKRDYWVRLLLQYGI